MCCSRRCVADKEAGVANDGGKEEPPADDKGKLPADEKEKVPPADDKETEPPADDKEKEPVVVGDGPKERRMMARVCM